MVIDMNEAKLTTLEDIRAFLAGTIAVEFSVFGKDDERYGHIATVLNRFGYKRLKKPDKGWILRYLECTTNYSRQQLTRIIKRWRTGKKLVKAYCAPKHGLVRKFTDADILVLAETDSLHGTLSGPATRHLMARALNVFGDARYERLATISVGHLYNLRKRHGYIDRRRVFAKTRPTGIAIGERRAPAPDGRPGFIRIDSVHQGDQDGLKGVYHINAVDCVTQWELVATCEKISEAYLLPVIEALLAGFPFGILGFHADNGSEYINHAVAQLLEKLLVEFTKSRAYRTQDNALVEGKNGAIIRKLIGYGHIPAEHAGALQKFYAAQLNPYLNFHRPCGFATVSLDARGKRTRQYKLEDYATPYQKLKSLPEAADYLKEGIGLEQLDRIAATMSDTEFAKKMSAAKAKLLRACKIESPLPPPRFL